ncbi:MAG: hypothetical protein ACU84H_16675 [Gammaproteobacteria bacterium]
MPAKTLAVANASNAKPNTGPKTSKIFQTMKERLFYPLFLKRYKKLSG